MTGQLGTSALAADAMAPLVQPIEICGPWLIRATDDSRQASARGQALMLFHDGSYVWSPAPEWARSGGLWGVSVTDAQAVPHGLSPSRPAPAV